MANKKISALTAGTTPTGTELAPVVQGGQTVSLTVAQVASGGVTLYASSYGISASNTAADNSAGWVLLKTAIGTGGKYVVLWPGKAQFASALDCSNLTNVIFQGQGGRDLTYSGNFGTVIHFTGTGSGNIISMNEHRGVFWRDLQVVYSSNSFTGTMFNCLTSFSSGCGSGFENVQCYQITNNGHTAGQCFYIRNNVDVLFFGCYISHATYGIVGLFSGDPGEINVISISHCTFISLKNAAFANPLIGCSFYKCNFELSDTNTPAGIISTSPFQMQNLSITNCIFADATVTGTWILLGDCFGLSISGGGFFGNNVADGITAISIGSTVLDGISITGVEFGTLAVGINLACQPTNQNIRGNCFTNVTTKTTGSAIVDIGSFIYVIAATGVNMNSVADTTFNVTLPSGYTRYRIQAIMVCNASADLTAATTVHYQMFTAAAGGGTAVTADTTSTISSTAASTNNNAQFIGPSIGAVFNNAQLFFRVITAHGTGATADVYLQIQPLL